MNPDTPHLAATRLGTRHVITHSLLAVLTICGVCTPAHAGPLLDRLKERREAQAPQRADTQTPPAPSSAPSFADGHGAPPPPGMRVLRDVAYGTDPRQRMDLYLPATQPAQGVVFMVHGGAWRMGSKDSPNVATHKVQHWLPKGLAVITIDYRLLPQAPVATQTDDVRTALAHAQQHAPQWALPAERFVLMGHSAGAHLVALVSADPAKALSQGAVPWLGTVVLDSAVLNVPVLMRDRHARLYDTAFGTDPTAWPALSPFHHLTPQARPMLLVCSSQRPDNPCRQAEGFAAQGRAAGLHMAVLPQALSHADINGMLGQPGAYTDAVDHFLAGLHPAWSHLAR